MQFNTPWLQVHVACNFKVSPHNNTMNTGTKNRHSWQTLWKIKSLALPLPVYHVYPYYYLVYFWADHDHHSVICLLGSDLWLRFTMFTMTVAKWPPPPHTHTWYRAHQKYSGPSLSDHSQQRPPSQCGHKSLTPLLIHQCTWCTIHFSVSTKPPL